MIIFCWPFNTACLNKDAFIMYDLVGGGRFFWGGFQNFLVKMEGVSKFCRTHGGGGGSDILAMINLDDLGETEKLTRLRTTSTSNAVLPHI